MEEGKILQDRPRPGGFPDIPFKRNNPVRGPSSLALFGIVTGTIAFGYYRLIRGNHRRQYRSEATLLTSRRLEWEKKESRLAIFPLLQAEEDRTQIRLEHQRDLAERLIMSEVNGWKASEKLYHTARYVEPVSITSEGGLHWTS